MPHSASSCAMPPPGPRQAPSPSSRCADGFRPALHRPGLRMAASRSAVGPSHEPSKPINQSRTRTAPAQSARASRPPPYVVAGEGPTAAPRARGVWPPPLKAPPRLDAAAHAPPYANTPALPGGLPMLNSACSACRSDRMRCTILSIGPKSSSRVGMRPCSSLEKTLVPSK